MERPAANRSYYLSTGLKAEKSGMRKGSEAGRLAGYIIDRIPEDYDVYADSDLNEVHLAEEIIKTCGRYIRYCPQIGWMVYKAEEGRWTERGALPAVEETVKHFGHLLYEGAKKTRPAEEAFAGRILSAAGISAIKAILKNDAVISADEELFDANPDLLNCMGACYDLRAGECRPAAPEDMFSKTTLCRAGELKPLAGGGGWETPEMPEQFEDFIYKVTGKDGEDRPDLAKFILFYFGYCLTGDNGASFFVNFHGAGKNGKSVLLNLMLELFGGYAAPLPKDVVIENRFQSQFDLAPLAGIRLAVLTDAPEGQLNMDQLKSIISGDAVNAKRKYKDDFKFKPVCKIAVGSNPKLRLKDTGMAVRRRVRMAPFDYIIQEGEEVTNYHRRLLKEEAPGILSFLIYLAHAYYCNGEGPKAFPACGVVDEASKEYMDSEDLVGRWKEERTAAAEGGAESSSDLYDDFVKWAEGQRIRKIMAMNKFGEHLSAHVPGKTRTGGKTHYLNIKLLETKLKESRPPGG